MSRSKVFRNVIKSLRSGTRSSGSFLKRLSVVGGSAALIKGGLGYLENLIDKKLNEAMGDGAANKALTHIFPSEKPQPTEQKPLSIHSIISAIDIERKEIVPELGPHSGQYAQHLNLIIKRVASLESSVLTQADLIARLEGSIGKYNEEERKERDRKKQKEREDTIENRTFLRNAARSGLNAAGTGYNRIASVVKPFLLPVAALALASSMDLMDTESPNARLITDENIDRALDVFEKVETFTTSAAGATLMTGSRALGASKSIAAGVNTAAAGAASRASNVIRNSSTAQSSFQFASQAGRVISNTFDFSGIMQTAGKFGNAAKANRFIASITRAGTFIDGLAKHASKFVETVRSFVAGLPPAIGKFLAKAGKKVVKWVLIIEAVKAMWRSANYYMMGAISEEQFHEDNKKQVNNIISLFGVPWLMFFIGSFLGPVGVAAGFIAGIIWQEKIYSYIGMEHIVNLLYDWFVLGKDIKELGLQLWNKIMSHFSLVKFFKDMGDSIIEFGKNTIQSTSATITSFFSSEKTSTKDIKTTVVVSDIENVHYNKIDETVEMTIGDKTVIEKETNNKLAEIETRVKLKNEKEEHEQNDTDKPEFVSNLSAFTTEFTKSIDDIISPDVQNTNVTELNKIYSAITMKELIDGEGETSSTEINNIRNMVNNTVSSPNIVTNNTSNIKNVSIVPVALERNKTNELYNAGKGIASAPELASSTYQTADRFLAPGLVT